MEFAVASVYVGDDGRSEGRRLSPSRRLFECARQCAGVSPDRRQRLLVDAADVSLQWLDVPVGRDGRGRHARVPAPCRARTDIRGDSRASRHSPMRRADRAQHANPRARRSEGRVRSSRRRRHRRCRAAVRGDRSDGRDGLSGDPSVRIDRVVRTRNAVRVAERMECARTARARPADGAPGRRDADTRCAAGRRLRNDGARTARWRNAR